MMAALRVLLEAIGPLTSWGLSALLSLAGRLSYGDAALVLLGLVLLQAAFALGLQATSRWLVRRRVERGEEGALSLSAVLGLELGFSLVGPVFLPLYGVYAGVSALWRWITRRAEARAARKAREAADESEDEAEQPPEPDEEQEAKKGKAALPPHLVAGHGPSYLLGAAGAAGLVLAGLGMEPLLRTALGLGGGQSVYDTLTLGRLPGAALSLPLSSTPSRALLVVGFVFLVLLSTLARGVRLLEREWLYADLLRGAETPTVLPRWRLLAGHRLLYTAADAYRAWARPFGMAAWGALLLALFLGHQPPYAVPVSAVGLALLGVVAWTLNLVLHGKYVPAPPPEAAPAPPAPAPSSAGWAEVLAELAARSGGLRPLPHADVPRALTRREPNAGVPALVSPGLLELLPEGKERKLTELQARVLERLARMTHSGRRSASTKGALQLSASESQALDDVHGGLCVVAREGTGRTTLGLLAAADCALAGSRTTLLLAPTEAAADALAARGRLALGASSLRWNVWLRRMGAEAARDLEEGVVPDVLVAAPGDLLGPLLERPDVLEALGLVVVDDAEELAGPAEAHVQLALRRLFARLRDARAAKDPGAKLDVRVLVMSGPSMQDAHLWQEGLVPGVRYADPLVFLGPVASAPVRPGPLEVTKEGALTRTQLAGDAPAGAVQVFHDLPRLRPVTGGQQRTRLRPSDVMAACEAVGAPWCFRATRDGERARGLLPYRLAQEPRFRVEDPEKAAVVLLQGPVACVDREQDRLAFAGASVAGQLRVPVVAFVRVVDEDEAWVADEARSVPAGATRALLASFPRPAATHPVGVVRDRHLAAELLGRPVEVETVASLFGAEPLARLRALAREGLATVTTSRVATAEGLGDRVHLQLLSRGVSDGAAGDALASALLLPPPPTSVEDASSRAATVRVPSRPGLSWSVDAGSAHRRYYPGALFLAPEGRFEVTGRVFEGEVEGAGAGAGLTISAEPLADERVSVPLRRSTVRRRGAAAGTLGGLEQLARKRIQAGKRSLDVEAAAVEVFTEHVATLQLDPDGRVVKNRMIFTAGSPDRVKGTFRSAGLFIYPEPDARRGEGEVLDRAGMRLLAAVLRVALRSAYRLGDRSVEVALQWDPAGERKHSGKAAAEVSEEAPVDARTGAVGVEDALVLVDAQEGGTGATRAIARDGVGPLLHAAWALLGPAPGEDARWRWLLLHDDLSPDSDDDLDLLDQVGPESASRTWAEVSPRVRRWLEERIQLPGAEPVPATEPAPSTGAVPAAAALAWEPIEEGPEREWAATYARIEPDDAGLAEVAGRLASAADARTVKGFVGALDAAFEWMHAEIAYARDMDEYGAAEYVARVSEVLARRRGDCEDMALLFASFARRSGITARVVLIPGHALCQVALGDLPEAEVVAEVLRRDAARARTHGLRPMCFPNYQQKVAQGWERVGQAAAFRRVDASGCSYFGGREAEVAVTVDPDGAKWLCVDAAQSRVLGAVDPYKRPEALGLDKAQAVLGDDGCWAEGTVCAVYEQDVAKVVPRRLARVGSGSPAPRVQAKPLEGEPEATAPGEQPTPAPRPASVPYPRDVKPVVRLPRRSLPEQDLGAVFPKSLPGGVLTWRRLRWTFGAVPGGPRRPWVLDLAVDVRAVDATLGGVVTPPLKLEPETKDAGAQKDGPSPRVKERAADALFALEVVRPTLQVLAEELRGLLVASRQDSDDEEAERERAERLISRIVDEGCLRPYVGAARDRKWAVAQALATGTADGWGRKLLHAWLRAELVGSAVLSFNARGWPDLVVPEKAAAGDAGAGKRWTLSLGGKQP